MGSASLVIVLSAFLAMGAFVATPAIAQSSGEEEEAYVEVPPQPEGQLAKPDAQIRKRYSDPRGAFAEIMPDVYVKLKGKRARRMARFARWNQGLDGDRLAVYISEGYPYYRHYVNYGGVRTEVWNYRQKGISYVFSREGDLLETSIY